MGASYIGRFAPSPTGPLHTGSLLAALASWLDARANAGQWLLRLEDVDRPRSVAGLDWVILQQLEDCGLRPDLPPLWQSRRTALYQRALEQLLARAQGYPCVCSRRELEAAQPAAGPVRSRHTELIYPGTCRQRQDDRTASAWRLRTDTAPPVHWTDRRLGPQQQHVASEVGDFVLKRADGCFSYQLAVVVDDAAQGITDVVRGEDLCNNTARQILLQRALGLPTPRYLHTPLVLGANLEKLSKQNGAEPIDSQQPLQALNAAAKVLSLPTQTGTLSDALNAWVKAWATLWPSAAPLYNRAL